MPLPTTALFGAVRHVIVLPPVRAIAGHATRYVLLGTIIPMGLFYGAFASVGFQAALVIGLVWIYGLIAHRLLTGKRIEATLILTALLITSRTVLAWMTGSAFLYFLQPTLSTFITASALIGSVIIGKPFTEKATRDYIPLPRSLVANPAIKQFFRRVSLLWGIAYLLNGSVTLYLLMTSSVGEFILLSKVGGLTLTGLSLAASIGLFLYTLRSESITLRCGHHEPEPVPHAPVATAAIPVLAGRPLTPLLRAA